MDVFGKSTIDIIEDEGIDASALGFTETDEPKLKKGLFGGYSQKGVDNYICNMKENMSRIKEQMEQQVRDISSEKSNITRECSILRTQLAETEADIIKLREEISGYQGFEAQLEEKEKKLAESEEEILRLRKLVQEYTAMRRNKENFERELDEKDQYIARLNDDLEHYKNEYNTLINRVEELETELINERNKPNASDSREDVAEYRALSEELEQKYRELEVRCHELEKELETSRIEIDAEREKYRERIVRLERELEESRAAMDDGKGDYFEKISQLEKELEESRVATENEKEKYCKRIEELEKALERDKEENKDTQTGLVGEDVQKKFDKEILEIGMLYKQLQGEITKNRYISDELSKREEELNFRYTQMEEERERLVVQINEKDAQLADIQSRFEKQARNREDLEGKIESLYDNYKKSASKIESLEMELKEKQLLIEHYQENEKESILLKQDFELSKQTVAQLKDTVMQVMKHMETQSVGLQMYSDKYEQNREALNKAMEELTEIKLKNVELMDSLSNMTSRYEEIVKENLKMSKDMNALKKEHTALEEMSRITPLQSRREAHDVYKDKDNDKISYIDAYERARELISKFEVNDDKDDNTEGLA